MNTARSIMRAGLSRTMAVIARATVCGLATLPLGAVENGRAGPMAAERYAGMRSQSPFALATPSAPPAAPPSAWAANWYVSGIGRLGEVDFVTVKARDLSAQFSLYGQEPNLLNGVTLLGIDWSETVGQSTVTIRKGTEKAKLVFNEAEMHGSGEVPATNKSQTAGIPLPLAARSKPIPGVKTSAPTSRVLKIVAPPTHLRAPLSSPPPRSLQTAPSSMARILSPGSPQVRSRGLPKPPPR